MSFEFASLPQDKANHAVYGGVIFMVAAVIATFFGGNQLVVGLLATNVIALGKEIYDLVSKKGTPDRWDYVATVAGAIPPAVVCLIFMLGART